MVVAYLSNAALADEKFAGKQVVVTGRMKYIKAAGIRRLRSGGDQYLYVLEMVWEPRSPEDLKLTWKLPILLFHFTDDDRKQLAKLKKGQMLTIEGRPRRTPQVGKEDQEMIIAFDECKVLKAEDGKPSP